MRDYDIMDQMFLLPVNADTFVEAFSESSVPGVAFTVARHEDEVTVRSGDMIVAELYLTVLGGCVVRVAPQTGDSFEIAAFGHDRDDANATVEEEEAIAQFEDVIMQLGAIHAKRTGGKWRAMREDDRPPGRSMSSKPIWSPCVVSVSSDVPRTATTRLLSRPPNSAVVHVPDSPEGRDERLLWSEFEDLIVEALAIRISLGEGNDVFKRDASIDLFLRAGRVADIFESIQLAEEEA